MPAVPEFAFLTNHGKALLLIAHDPRIRMRDIAGLLTSPNAQPTGSWPTSTAPGTSIASARGDATSTASEPTSRSDCRFSATSTSDPCSRSCLRRTIPTDAAA